MFEECDIDEFLTKWERVELLAEENPTIKNQLDELRTILKMVTGEDW